jgi:hypothetical protein
MHTAFSTGLVHPRRTVLPGPTPAGVGVCPHIQRRTPWRGPRQGVPKDPPLPAPLKETYPIA